MVYLWSNLDNIRAAPSSVQDERFKLRSRRLRAENDDGGIWCGYIIV